jgi:hypothetical protein
MGILNLAPFTPESPSNRTLIIFGEADPVSRRTIVKGKSTRPLVRNREKLAADRFKDCIRLMMPVESHFQLPG